MLGIDVRADQLVAMPQDAPLGAELFMKELFVAEMLLHDHPKYYNAAGRTFSAEGKTAALKCLKITACAFCRHEAKAADKTLWCDQSQFASFQRPPEAQEDQVGSRKCSKGLHQGA